MTPRIATFEGPLDAISEGILLLDTAGNVVWFNRRLAELFGFPPDLHGKTRAELVEAMSARMVDPEGYARRVREIISTDEPRARDVLALKNARFIERTSLRHLVDGVRVGRILVYRDVTREQHVEAALQDSEARFRTVIAAAPDGILLSHGRRIVYVNDALGRALGRDPEELVDTSALDLLREDRAEVHEQALKLMESEQTGSVRERRMVRADGTIVHFESAAVYVEIGGEPTMVLFLRDITERRRMQAHLAVADRMASIGAMAAGIAHEINNPLAYVIANIELVRSHVADPEGRRMLDLAAEGCMRMKSVVGDLAMLSRTGEKEETERLLDVRWTLDASLNLAQALVSTRATIVTEYEEAPLVRANDARLSQVFLNLLLNAAQAIEPGNPEGNEIRVRCGPEGKRVVVTIADTGGGIAPEHLPHIFDPFFTTKDKEGTGLGLSICQSIVSGLGGQISAAARAGGGTVFRVELPSTET